MKASSRGWTTEARRWSDEEKGLEAKEYRTLAEAAEGKETDSPWSFQEEHGPADTLILDFWPPEV